MHAKHSDIKIERSTQKASKQHNVHSEIMNHVNMLWIASQYMLSFTNGKPQRVQSAV